MSRHPALQLLKAPALDPEERRRLYREVGTTGPARWPADSRLVADPVGVAEILKQSRGGPDATTECGLESEVIRCFVNRGLPFLDPSEHRRWRSVVSGVLRDCYARMTTTTSVFEEVDLVMTSAAGKTSCLAEVSAAIAASCCGELLGIEPLYRREINAHVRPFAQAADASLLSTCPATLIASCNRLVELLGRDDVWRHDGAGPALRCAAAQDSLPDPAIQVAFVVAAAFATIDDTTRLALRMWSEGHTDLVDALRRQPPVQLTTRHDAADGRLTWLYLGSNADGSEAHLFGGGPHRCPGAAFGGEVVRSLEAWCRKEPDREICVRVEKWSSSAMFLRPESGTISIQPLRRPR